MKAPKRKSLSKAAPTPLSTAALTLRKLKVGEIIKVNDWCCGGDSQPVRVIVGTATKITRHHYPHYRIELR